MFTLKQENPFQSIINDAVQNIEILDPNSEEYREAVKQLEGITRAQANIKKPAEGIPPAVLISAGVTIGTTLLVLNYERLSVIGSKAFSFIKP